MNSKIQFFFLLLISWGIGAQKKDTISVEQLDEVVIDSQIKLKSKEPSLDKIEFSKENLKNSISFLGAQDPVKLIQLTSGIQSGAEGQSGFLVRGGNPSMNLVYLDDIYLHNLSHIGGFFPLLNSDFIQKMTFYKGGFAAEDGGRLSSITHIQSKNNLGDARVSGSIGLLSAKAIVTFKIPKLKTSVLISGRRTFLELINAAMGKNASVLGDGKSYYFYDYLIKIQTRINSKHRVSFTNFNTQDTYESNENKNQLNFGWKNELLGLAWNYNSFHRFKNKLSISSSKFKLSSRVVNFPFDYSFQSKFDVQSIKNKSSVSVKNHDLNFGIQLHQIDNTPKNVSANILGETQIDIVNDNNFKLLETSFFAQDLWKLKDNLSVSTGLRLTNYQYKKEEIYKKWYLEPRVNFNYEFKKNNALKLSYQYVRQYLHQTRVTTFSLPIDYYLPSRSDLPFQKNSQISVGYVFDRKNISGDVTFYHKKINNYSEFKNGALNNLFNSNLYNDVVIGMLNSYGIETHVDFRFKKLKGAVNYTFSRTQAKFDEINKGRRFPVVFDRPHNFNLSLSYQVNKKMSLNSLFVFTSGQNYTPVKDLRVINEFLILNFGTKNSIRFPSYHRLDLGLNYQLKNTKKFKSSLNFTLYNAYNRQNAFYLNQEVAGSIEEGNFTIDSFYESLFPIIPSLTWNFSF